MKCVHCGYEFGDGFAFCPHCGRPLPQESDPQAVPQESAVPNEKSGLAIAHVLQVLKDPLFLVICILLSISALINLFSGALPLLEILAAVFLWLTYARSRDNIADEKLLRCVSGVTYAVYVIYNVAAVMLMVAGVCLAAFSVPAERMFLDLMGRAEIMELLGSLTELEEHHLSMATQDLVTLLASAFVRISVEALVSGVILLIINIAGIRNIHRFVKSVYKSLEADQIRFDKCRQAKTWLMVYGVYTALTAIPPLTVANTTGFLAAATSAATLVIASILVKKHFAQWAD